MRFCLRAGLGVLGIALTLTLMPAPGLADDYLVEPRPPVTTRDPRFGIVQSIQSPDLALRAGATWERIIFPWAEMQPERGKLMAGQFSEQQIRDQVARGFDEVGVLIYTPVWAAPNPNKAPRNVVPRNLYLDWNHPDNYWGQFTAQVAARYKGLVDNWVIWNEPDLYDYGSRWFFDGSFEDYYQLVKVAYQAIKASNPRAKVILGGMAYWWDRGFDRTPYLAALLEVGARDPTAKKNNWYFDVVAVHTYAAPLNSYAEPLVMRRILDAREIVKPIWIMESNAVPGDDPRAPASPGDYRASQEEQASYIIQSYALGIAAGVERQAVYKMIDEKPEDGQYFGLVRNDGTIRPAYVAYQVAATYLSNATWASYSWTGSSSPPNDAEVTALLNSNRDRYQWIWPGQVNRVILERGDHLTTVVWNASPVPVSVRIPAAAPFATAISQYGDPGQVVAHDGSYVLDLPATAHNADSHDYSIYMIGGRPWILDEAVIPLPPSVLTRIELLWPLNSAPVAEADRANVTAQLLLPDGSGPVPCRWEPRVLLWGSLNGGQSEVVSQGIRQMVQTETADYPVWNFSNVLVGPARFGNFITFFVTVDGVKVSPEYWIYGGDNPTPLQRADPPATSCR